MRCVPAADFNVAKARAWRSSIDADPVYQRAGDLWSSGQRQRFIDSLLNGFDVPKIYLHDLRGIDPRKVYAVVDGKQRLTAIWDFLADGFGLAADFVLQTSPETAIDAGAPTPGLRVPGTPAPGTPAPGLRFSQLGPRWREALLRTPIAVVLIQDATEVDIDELFSRLNNGVPLTPAERRHAIGGATMEVVRQIAGRPALAALLAFPDSRRAHADIAARLVARAALEVDGIDAPVDPTTEALEAMARRGRTLPAGTRQALLARADELLARAARALAAADASGRGRATRSDPEAAWSAIRAAIDAEALSEPAPGPRRRAATNPPAVPDAGRVGGRLATAGSANATGPTDDA